MDAAQDFHDHHGFSLRRDLLQSSPEGVHAFHGLTVHFQNQITESTGVTGSLQQRLFEKLTLNVTGGFTSTSYQSSFLGFSVNRQDDRSTINIRLSYPFIKRATASLFYDWSDNSSTQDGFQYQSNQVGLELGYRF